MARLTRAQREWRPGMKKKARSVRTMFASTVLTLEAFLVFFLALALFGLHRDTIPPALTLGGGIGLAVVCILTCALLGRPAGYLVGWIIQLVLVALGFVEPFMFLVGVLFGIAWWYAVTKGRSIDMENARRAREQEEWEAAHPEASAG